MTQTVDMTAVIAFVRSLWNDGFPELAHCVARFHGIAVEIR